MPAVTSRMAASGIRAVNGWRPVPSTRRLSMRSQPSVASTVTLIPVALAAAAGSVSRASAGQLPGRQRKSSVMSNVSGP